jgi:hypothetical protein
LSQNFTQNNLAFVLLKQKTVQLKIKSQDPVAWTSLDTSPETSSEHRYFAGANGGTNTYSLQHRQLSFVAWSIVVGSTRNHYLQHSPSPSAATICSPMALTKWRHHYSSRAQTP